MNNVKSIFMVLFKDEMKEKQWLREIIGIFSVAFIIAFIVPSNYILLRVKSTEILLKGNIVITFYLSMLSIISKVKDKKLKLLISLPINKENFVFLYSFVIFIKNNLIKIIPLVLTILLVNLYNQKITLLNFITLIIIFLITGYLSCIISIAAVFFIYDRNIISIKESYSYIKFNWLKRELARFIKDRTILINHIGYSIFILFFIINTIVVSKSGFEFLLFILCLLSTCSTPGILFSYEKENINLLKSLPISMKKLFIVKYIFSIVITVPMYIGAYALIYIFYKNNCYFDLLILIICNLFLTTFIKLYFDFKIPNFNWSHSKQMFEDKRKYKIWGMCMAVSMSWIGYPHVNIVFIITAQVIITLILTCIIGKFSTSW